MQIRVGLDFLHDARAKHPRFLELAWVPSYPTLDWLTTAASQRYATHKLGVFDGVEVVEFTPQR
jgi:hypothetical protein